MTSNSRKPIFARKGKATPTPIPEDGIGSIERLYNKTSPRVEETKTTIIRDEPAAPPGDDKPVAQTEAASMLGIPLEPREIPASPPDDSDSDEQKPTEFALVSTLPLPDNRSMVVVEGSQKRSILGQALKLWPIMLILTIVAAILGGAYFSKFIVGNGAHESNSTVSVPIQKPAPIAMDAPPDQLIENATSKTEESPKADAVIDVPSEVATKKPVPVPKQRVAPAPASKLVGTHSIQLGSLPTSRDAQRHLRTLKRRHGDILYGLKLSVVPGSIEGKGRVWRVRVIGLPSAAAAKRICQRLKAQKTSCLVLRRR